MFAGSLRTRGQRRAIVLVVVLAMLGILALIGVTFATFSGQARTSARNYALSQTFPQSAEVMDFGLAQLITDTGNPVSALRGHSLLRDMYGNDAYQNGYLTGRPDTGAALTLTGASAVTSGAYAGLWMVTTNFAASDPAFYGYNFTRWILRFPPTANGGTFLVSESFEIVVDDVSGSNRVFYVTPPDTNTPKPAYSGYISPLNPNVTSSALIGLQTGYPFVLDGRYLRAFNGPGMTSFAEYGNFRFNGQLQNSLQNSANSGLPGNPDNIGMDEDYDACDLENWFLAIQSADGTMVIPSFHRPGILVYDLVNPNPLTGTVYGDDWQNYPMQQTNLSSLSAGQQQAAYQTWSKFLRPRAADGHSLLAFPDLNPTTMTTHFKYDIDNDADGTTDSVWLDLGFPPRRDATGRMFKPLYAFMVIGLNGRMPLNTAGNLQARSSAGVNQYLHAAHLGNSPSEIDPTFALQNSVFPGYKQTDSAGIGVNITQLRNLLTGTRPQSNNFTLSLSPGSINLDANAVAFGNDIITQNQLYFYLPNNMADVFDLDPTTYSPGGGGVPYSPLATGTAVIRATPSVGGRYGEADVILTNLGLVPAAGTLGFSTTVGAGLAKNPVYSDTQDDNFNTFDPWPTAATGENGDMYDPAGALALPVERIRRYVTPVDVSGDGAVTTYNSSLTTKTSLGLTYTPPPNTAVPPIPTSLGADIFGRVSFLLYFRPPGVPLPYQTVSLTLNSFTQGATAGTGGVYTDNVYSVTSGTPGSSLNGTVVPYDVASNLLHSYEAARNPLTTAATNPFKTINSTGVVAAMPYDLNSGTAIPSYNYGMNTSGPSATPPFLVSPNMNEADEVNVYAPNQYDQVFGPSDLEWLYRNQDTDGDSLSSRLQYLAPISFTNPNDGTRRCRLFCTDTWDTTSSVWTNDNPGNAFPNNSTLYNIAYATAINQGNTVAASQTIAASLSPYANGGFGAVGAYTPELAHRERKINLNYPLPVSTNPYEPIRQKWISNTYQAIKSILPPLSVDTPQELAQLSQFVINIIDFRDPDCTTTVWTNPDVVVEPPVSNTTTYSPPILYSSNTSSPFAAPTTDPPSPTATIPLVQFGMEYNPIAINEVLAYSFLHKDVAVTSGTPSGVAPTNRFFVELINTLSQSNATGSDPSIIDLTNSNNWQLVIANDDNVGRPDPVTGQDPSYFFGEPTFPPSMGSVPTTTYAPFWTIPLNENSFAQPVESETVQSPQPIVLPSIPVAPGITTGTTNNLNTTGINAALLPQAAGSPPTQTAFNYYFVLGNTTPAIQNKPGNNTVTVTTVNGETIAICENQQPDQNTFPITPISGGTTVKAPQQILVLNGNGTGATTPTTVFDPFDTNWADPYYQSSPASPIPAPASGKGQYYWLYLRRTANPYMPFNPPAPNPEHNAANPLNPWVVVDSMRFPFIEGGGTVTQVDPIGVNTTDPTPDKIKQGTNALYSVQRLQPFRGGHAVLPVGAPTGSGASLSIPAVTGVMNTAYGFSEQVALPVNQSGNFGYFGNTTNAGMKITQPIYHTLGVANSYGVPAGTMNIDPEWDYLPFNDRDFTSVAELLLVPGCPPGLFTKQFVEEVPYIATAAGSPVISFPAYNPATNMMSANGGTTAQLLAPGTSWTLGKDYSNPFNFFANIDYTNNTSLLLANLIRQPHTYPYLADNFYYSGYSGPLATGATGTPTLDVQQNPNNAAALLPVIGGPSGAGWHRMLEFFEVPSPANGATGTVDQGMNYDWMRQDLKPGLLNINLIIDEEVFFGLMGGNNSQNGNTNTDPVTPMNIGRAASSNTYPPNVVTQINAGGGVNTSFPMPNIGYYDINTATNASGTANNNLKQAFVDFLILRHGGTGYLYQWASGTTADRPYHSLSYPDINYTMMRPAALPQASTSGTPNPITSPNSYGTTTNQNTTGPNPSAVNDPGIKTAIITNYGTVTPASPNTAPYTVAWNTYAGGTNSYALPEPIPARRLFQVPDAFSGIAATGGATYVIPPSNASASGDTFVNPQYQVSALQSNWVDLTDGTYTYLGGTIGGNQGTATPNVVTYPDRRQSPYFRTEWLQRMLNLTTVRTHQFAVWITVGFFEVTRHGDPAYANDPTYYPLSYDILGNELTSTSGETVRYRSFFIIDRTKAAGYNPSLPTDFRTCVLYRQTIQ